MKESRKRTGSTISGLVRKHLSEIEKRMIEGESRDQILDWLKEETGREIERTTFFTVFYRARKWAEKNKIKAAYLAALSAQPVQSVAPEPAILTSSKKKPKKHVERAADKPEVRRENVLPENPTGQQRLRAALAIGTPPPVLDWEEDDRFAKYRNGK
ncbi:hypothetical protein NBRC3278_3359 [Acetobacter pasteurianus NBRC 3278]|uniref:Uncharacterized protein n=1 Tax=Acetobacter pasteurianus NBRC 3278 TaxID=1226660 RepID=A0A401X8Y2_ACEPA|nr:hypothetical protein [Acetobacter pasteurianus]GCD64266.1 hypothetical protein NBRC3278_3359 [Acetobacter pasteurianus NBRC 3278]